jgi:hypothetical protein
MLAPKKVAATRGTLITSAVVSLTWGSSKRLLAFKKKSSHKQKMVVMVSSKFSSRFKKGCVAFESGGYYLPQ